MVVVNALVVAAMKEEMQAFREMLSGYKIADIPYSGGEVTLANKNGVRLLLVVTGVGMVSAATGVTWALSNYDPEVIVNIGSAGGLSPDARVGQVVLGTQYVNAGADGTVFGYERGQVPGQPAHFATVEKLLAYAQQIVRDNAADPQADYDFIKGGTPVRTGMILSSDAFITEKNVGDMRQAFPEAIATDMESQAIAQVAAVFHKPFISVRAISDLCGAPDEQEVSFHAELAVVAEASARVACTLLRQLPDIRLHIVSEEEKERIRIDSLLTALYLVYAFAADLPPLADFTLPAGQERTVKYKMPDDAAQQNDASAYIAATLQKITKNSRVSMSARKYDAARLKVCAHYQLPTGRGVTAWPPTSQTIIKGFRGFWNDALISAGFMPQEGRSRGGLKFSAQDYRQAMQDFLATMVEEKKSNSYGNYLRWAEAQKKETKTGSSRPSGAGIRQHFGSWNAAVQAGASNRK